MMTAVLQGRAGGRAACPMPPARPFAPPAGRAGAARRVPYTKLWRHSGTPIGYRGGLAMPRPALPCPVQKTRRWSLSLVQSKGPRDGDPVARDRMRLARTADGDDAAFAEIVAEETPRLLRFAATILGAGAPETEEVAQEALIRLWRQAETWTPDARISTWLHRVVYRLSIDALRRRRTAIDIGLVEETIVDDTLEPEASLIVAEDARALRAAVEALPERQRTAIVLCHFQGLGQAEAAAVMEVSEAAYESLLARGRRRLRALLAGQR
jgi:RNA polymerase sigma-70 factor (ECF subfamily)